MAQSLARLVTHIIFSTKHRRPLITPEYRQEMNAYLGGVCVQLDSAPILISTVADHVHILCCLSRTVSLAGLLEELKKSSSAWLKTRSPDLNDFFWQGGYAAFSVSQSNVPAVMKYIAHQDEHHRQTTFQEELIAFLQKHGVQFDDRYIWD